MVLGTKSSRLQLCWAEATFTEILGVHGRAWPGTSRKFVDTGQPTGSRDGSPR